MKIIYLKSNNNESEKLEKFLTKDNNEVVSFSEKISYDFVFQYQPDIIISYNYRFILSKNIICIPELGVINLHISFLPWNKGADPNFWSHIDKTPKGVTIHYINEGIDTGDIIAQSKVEFLLDDTLNSSYIKLHHEIQRLFYDTWPKIKGKTIERKKQEGNGTTHRKNDKAVYDYLLKQGWDTPLCKLKR